MNWSIELIVFGKAGKLSPFFLAVWLGERQPTLALTTILTGTMVTLGGT